jgi:predicted RNase H-like HicB family nuclease
MRNEFTAVVERSGKWFIAFCPEIPGANGQGRTLKAALVSLAEAIELILVDRRDADPVIDEIRAIRHRISARFGHDTGKLIAYYMELQKKHKDRLLYPVDGTATNGKRRTVKRRAH